MNGAAAASKDFDKPELKNNIAYQYAAARNVLYRKGKVTELLISYEPGLQYFNEWWKQLFGESEGKDKKVFTHPALTSPQIYILSVNISKMAVVTFLKQLLKWTNHATT